MKKKSKKILITLVILILIVSVAYGWLLRLTRQEVIMKGDIAFYVIDTAVEAQSETVTLDSIKPGEIYIYNITVSNSDGTNISKVDMEYDINIRATTNLPLKYTLTETTENAPTTTSTPTVTTTTDEPDGVYYKSINTNINRTLPKGETTVTHTYELAIQFDGSIIGETDTNTIGAEYSDTIELIEVTIDAEQSDPTTTTT